MSLSKEKSKASFLNNGIKKNIKKRNSKRLKSVFENADGGVVDMRGKNRTLFRLRQRIDIKSLISKIGAKKLSIGESLKDEWKERKENLSVEWKERKENLKDELEEQKENLKVEFKKRKESIKVAREKRVSAKFEKREREEIQARERAKRDERIRREKKIKQILSCPFGKIEISVKTENPSRLYSALKKEGVLFPKSFEGGNVTFFCYAKHSAKIIALLERLCYNYQIIGNKGTLPALMGALTRVGVVAGTLLLIAAIIVYPKFVIKIVADGTLTNDAVDVLNEYGVVEGAFLPSVDTAAIEERLLQLDGISFASVVRRGTRVYVTMREELDKEYLISVKSDRVVASKDCVVSRVLVYDGTAVVKEGDSVKAGQTLIEPYLTVREEQIPSRAGGEIYGIVNHTKTMFFPYAMLCSEEGKKKSITKLSLFGDAPSMPISPFECYRVNLTVTTNDFMIPYKVYNWTFTELKAIEKINQQTDAEMRRKTMSSLASQLPAGATLISYSTDSVANELGVTVTATATVEERVG